MTALDRAVSIIREQIARSDELGRATLNAALSIIEQEAQARTFTFKWSGGQRLTATITHVGDRRVSIPVYPGETLRIGLTKTDGEVVNQLQWNEH